MLLAIVFLTIAIHLAISGWFILAAPVLFFSVFCAARTEDNTSAYLFAVIVILGPLAFFLNLFY